LALLLAAAGCDEKTGTPTRPVRVLAAASLKELLTDIAAEHSKKDGAPVQFQFEASSTLSRQIQEGAPADVFITAAPEWLTPLKAIERFDWLSNKLVLVVPKHAKDPDLFRLDSLALADEQVPVGKYGKAAMAFMKAPIPERTIYGSNVRDVLSKVSQGGAQAGIVYATDAAIDPGVRVALTFPPKSHPLILYSAGLLTKEGKAFYEALKQGWAKELARSRGFVELP
jgi:molybdate transport system substrate-binding protein